MCAARICSQIRPPLRLSLSMFIVFVVPKLSPNKPTPNQLTRAALAPASPSFHFGRWIQGAVAAR